jgi:hypothetical protein
LWLSSPLSLRVTLWLRVWDPGVFRLGLLTLPGLSGLGDPISLGTLFDRRLLSGLAPGGPMAGVTDGAWAWVWVGVRVGVGVGVGEGGVTSSGWAVRNALSKSFCGSFIAVLLTALSSAVTGFRALLRLSASANRCPHGTFCPVSPVGRPRVGDAFLDVGGAFGTVRLIRSCAPMDLMACLWVFVGLTIRPLTTCGLAGHFGKRGPCGPRQLGHLGSPQGSLTPSVSCLPSGTPHVPHLVVPLQEVSGWLYPWQLAHWEILGRLFASPFDQ